MIRYKVSRFYCVPMKSDFCSGRALWLDPSSKSCPANGQAAVSWISFFIFQMMLLCQATWALPPYMQSLTLLAKDLGGFYMYILCLSSSEAPSRSSQVFWLLCQPPDSVLLISRQATVQGKKRLGSAFRRRLCRSWPCSCLPRTEVSAGDHVLM